MNKEYVEIKFAINKQTLISWVKWWRENTLETFWYLDIYINSSFMQIYRCNNQNFMKKRPKIVFSVSKMLKIFMNIFNTFLSLIVRGSLVKFQWNFQGFENMEVFIRLNVNATLFICQLYIKKFSIHLDIYLRIYVWFYVYVRK